MNSIARISFYRITCILYGFLYNFFPPNYLNSNLHWYYAAAKQPNSVLKLIRLQL